MQLISLILSLAGGKSKRVQARKSYLADCFYACINSEVELSAASLPKLQNGDERLIRSIAAAILSEIHGTGAKRVMKMLEIWKLRL